MDAPNNFAIHHASDAYSTAKKIMGRQSPGGTRCLMCLAKFALLRLSPPRQAGGRGQDEGEGFVEGSGADEEAEGEGGGPAKFIALPLA